MKEQISIKITILATLLTSGFLMIFIERQQVFNNIAERFYYKLRSFYHSFSNYVKFVSSFESCFTFKIIRNLAFVKR